MPAVEVKCDYQKNVTTRQTDGQTLDNAIPIYCFPSFKPHDILYRVCNSPSLIFRVNLAIGKQFVQF